MTKPQARKVVRLLDEFGATEVKLTRDPDTGYEVSANIAEQGHHWSVYAAALVACIELRNKRTTSAGRA